MKYIIEVDEKSTEGLYRAKGFKTLVFDDAGLKKLEPVSDALQHGYDEGYQEGLTDGWVCARKILDMTPFDRESCFGVVDLNTNHGIGIITHISSRYCLEKIKEYEEKKAKAETEIKVGDEVDDGVGLAVIIGIRDDGTYDGIADSGGHVHITKVYKITGRHFPQIEEMLKQMKGD